MHSHFYDWNEMVSVGSLVLTVRVVERSQMEDYVFFSYVLLPSYHIFSVPAAAWAASSNYLLGKQTSNTLRFTGSRGTG
jgi:hypothetical protein